MTNFLPGMSDFDRQNDAWDREDAFHNRQLLDDLIVGYCEIFNEQGELIDERLDIDYQDTNDSYYDEMEV
jgi:hypothetical protein